MGTAPNMLRHTHLLRNGALAPSADNVSGGVPFPLQHVLCGWILGATSTAGIQSLIQWHTRLARLVSVCVDRVTFSM
jgi:hypothetical protein